MTQELREDRLHACEIGELGSCRRSESKAWEQLIEPRYEPGATRHRAIDSPYDLRPVLGDVGGTSQCQDPRFFTALSFIVQEGETDLHQGGARALLTHESNRDAVVECCEAEAEHLVVADGCLDHALTFCPGEQAI